MVKKFSKPEKVEKIISAFIDVFKTPYKPETSLDEMLKRFVYIKKKFGPTEEPLIGDRKTNNFESLTPWRNKQGCLPGTLTELSDLWLQDPDRKNVNHVGYYPNGPAIFKDVSMDEKPAFNGFSPLQHEETENEDKIKIFNQFFAEILPDENRELFLDWLAITATYAEKISFIPLLIHSKNNGVWFVPALIKTLIDGPKIHKNTANCSTINLDSIVSNPEDLSFINETVFTHIENVKHKRAFPGKYDLLKRRFNLPFVMGWRSLQKLTTYTNFLLTSHENDSLDIPEDDTKIFCIKINDKPKGQAYQDVLKNYLKDPEAMNQVWSLLKNRAKILIKSGTVPGIAPDTPSKKFIIGKSRR